MIRLTIILTLCVSLTCKSNTINNKKENAQEDEIIKVDNSENNNKKIPFDTLRINFPKIGELIDSITLTIERHEWDKFIQYCDKENHEQQVSIGINNEQYIFEILNLRTKNDADYIKEIQTILSQIKSMIILTYNYDKGFQEFFFQFKGVITTKDNSKYNFWFELKIDENDAKIIGNVG